MRTRENGGIARWLGGALGIMTLLVLAGDLRAVEFLRADANSDTKVSISDAYFTLSFLFSGGQRPECEETADTNGDGQVNLTDGIATLAFLVMGGDAPAAPFPTPGEHAGPGANLPCDSTGTVRRWRIRPRRSRSRRSRPTEAPVAMHPSRSRFPARARSVGSTPKSSTRRASSKA